MRKVIAIVAALGCIAGIYAFVASFFGLTMHWWIPRQDEWTVVMPD